MKDIRLVIGNKNHSSWSLCPWLMLKMFDVDFDEIQIALYQDNTAEKLGPYSPSLKVPVLLHREITVWDSLAICETVNGVVLVVEAEKTRSAVVQNVKKQILMREGNLLGIVFTKRKFHIPKFLYKFL